MSLFYYRLLKFELDMIKSTKINQSKGEKHTVNTRIGKFLFFIFMAFFMSAMLYQQGTGDFPRQESLVRGFLIALIGANASMYGSKYPTLIAWLIERNKLRYNLVIGWFNIVTTSIIGISLMLLIVLVSKEPKDYDIVVSCITFGTLFTAITSTIRIGTLFSKGAVLDMHGMVIVKGEDYQYWNDESFVNMEKRWFIHEDKTHVCFTQGLNPNDTYVIPVWRVRAGKT